jgi:hypothetical protein
VTEAVLVLALCHNVTPVYESGAGEGDTEVPEVDQGPGELTYQASSPDEVALVEWAGWAGLRLAARTMTELTLTAPQGNCVILPFPPHEPKVLTLERNTLTKVFINVNCVNTLQVQNPDSESIIKRLTWKNLGGIARIVNLCVI